MSEGVHHGEGQVKEQGGEKVLTFSIPRAFQGHTFALDFQKSDHVISPIGPFLVEFVLCSDYLIHERDISSVVPEKGYSYLRIGTSLKKLKTVALHYSFPSPDVPNKEATLSFTTADDRIQRIVLHVPEEDLKAALHVSSLIVHSILDNVTLRTEVPTQIRHIEIRPAAPGSRFMRRYLTVPYTAADIEKDDLTSSLAMPASLQPAVRLFREAITASRPHYRLLCLYRVREAVHRVQQTNNAALLAKGLVPSRPVQRVPDTGLTRQHFPNLIGKRVGAFLDHVRDHYRIPIAHFELNDYDKMVLDPADVRVDHRVDYTNAVLIRIAKQLILDERDLMQQHAL